MLNEVDASWKCIWAAHDLIMHLSSCQCRDDVMALFNNKLSCDDMLKPRTKFQNAANRLAGGNHLQFTCSMWPDKSRRETATAQNDSKMSIETGNFFPHLDTELVWATNGDLQFQVHLKPNQQVKCANADSIHAKAFFKAIPSEVYKKTVQIDNNHGNNQEPTTEQNLPTKLPSSSRHRSRYQKSPNID